MAHQFIGTAVLARSGDGLEKLYWLGCGSHGLHFGGCTIVRARTAPPCDFALHEYTEVGNGTLNLTPHLVIVQKVGGLEYPLFTSPFSSNIRFVREDGDPWERWTALNRPWEHVGLPWIKDRPNPQL